MLSCAIHRDYMILHVYWVQGVNSLQAKFDEFCSGFSLSFQLLFNKMLLKLINTLSRTCPNLAILSPCSFKVCFQ
jgi:hypothetical protein